MTVSAYQQLRDEILRSAVTNTNNISPTTKNALLNSLKFHFKNQINSRRQFEKITNFRELFDILETRDVISPDNVVALEEIVGRFTDKSDLIEKINEYKSSHVPRPRLNYYALKSTQTPQAPPLRPASNVNVNTGSPFNNVSQRKLQRIMDTITEEIGSFWRDLARHLNIRECTIHDIDTQHRTCAVKAEKIIKLYEMRADPDKWFFFLCEALEKARRADLSRSLKEIYCMNI